MSNVSVRTAFSTGIVLSAMFLGSTCNANDVKLETATSVLPRGYRDLSVPPGVPGAIGLLGGPTHTGSLKSKVCPPGGVDCPIVVRASTSPKDDDDDDDKGCTISVGQSWVLDKQTTTVTWKLHRNAQKKFEFLSPGVVLDDPTNFIAQPITSADRKTVTATLKPKTTGSVSSYTVYLTQNGYPCAGYDPIVVNRDN